MSAANSSENLESDSKSCASQGNDEMSVTLFGKINKFTKRQQEKIKETLKETKVKLVSSTAMIKEKTINLFRRDNKVMPTEVTEENIQNRGSQTSLEQKAANSANNGQAEDLESTAISVKQSEPTKQSELLQEKSGSPELVNQYKKQRTKVKKRRKLSIPKCSHALACNCVSTPADDEKDMTPSIGFDWNDTDYYTSVFVDNPDLMLPEEQLTSVIDAGHDGLIAKYTDIQNVAHQDTFIAAELPANNLKNRYMDVLCYDKTRVVLEDDKSQNYINANYVNSFEQKKGYICCQGPLPETVTDFWRMVWQEKVRTIVMTTNLEEDGRIKCSVYWPQQVCSIEEYGSFLVTNMDITKRDDNANEDIQTTKLCLHNKKTGKTRFLKHLLFLKWPDYGIPSSADAFLRLIQIVRKSQSERVKYDMPEWEGHPRGPPIIVHCSAGIGRSGTYICADICIYMLDLLGKVNIEQVVKNIRTQRALAVQMPDQYVFCHLAILQYAQKKGMIPDDVNLSQILQI